MKRLAELFWEFLRISSCVIGGGYAILAVSEDRFARKGWTAEGELLDRLSVFQMIPGLIATHTAVYVGNRRAGVWGAVVSVVAVALPAVAVFTLVSAGYASLPLENAHLQAVFSGLRAALTAVIASAVIRTILRGGRSAGSVRARAFFWILTALCLVALAGFGASVPVVLVGAMGVGLADTYCRPTRCACLALPLLLFLKYGLLGFGGGFALVPMYLQDFVGPSAAYLQLPADVFSNIMALSQATPGPVGVNCATYFGYRLAGVGGALAASVLLLLPGSLLAFAAFRSLERFRASRVVAGILHGVRPASLALMLVALGAFARASCTGWTPVALTLAGTVLLLKRRVGAVTVIVSGGLLSWILHMQTCFFVL